MRALNDLADPEVMLEVEVLESGRNKLLNLGLQYADHLTVNYLTAAGAAVAAGRRLRARRARQLSIHRADERHPRHRSRGR